MSYFTPIVVLYILLCTICPFYNEPGYITYAWNQTNALYQADSWSTNLESGIIEIAYKMRVIQCVTKNTLPECESLFFYFVLPSIQNHKGS